MNTGPGSPEIEQETPVAIPVQAGFWLRFFAFLIDLSFIQIVEKVLQLICGFWISSLLHSSSANSGDIVWDIVLSVLAYCLSIFLTGIVYFVGFEMSPFFATPGKFIMGLYVASDTLKNPTPIKILIRNIGRIFCYLTLGLGYCMAGLTSSKQGLHDMIAGTFVIRNSESPEQQRMFGAVFALLLFVAVSLLFPSEQTQTKVAVEPPLTISEPEVEQPEKPIVEPLPNPDEVIAFPSDNPGYLQTQLGKTDFTDVHSRSELVEMKSGPPGSMFSEKLRKLTFAFFTKKLSKNDHETLKKVSEFYVEPKKKIGQAAIVSLEVLLPAYLEICPANRITSSTIQFDPLALPQLVTSPGEVLRQNFDAPQLFVNNQFFSDCSSGMEDGGTVELAFQTTIQPSLNVPPVLTNIRIRDSFRARFVSHVNQYGGGQDAFGIFEKSKKKLTLGIFSQALSPADKKKMYRTGSVQSGQQKPTAVVIFHAPNAGPRIMRDQVTRYQITLFRQSSGPLNFPEGRKKVSAAFQGNSEAMPALLTGLLKTGERVTGKVNGWKNIETKKGQYRLHWTIPFNALLAIKE
jgi:uncharacterized RDD family membrane protein YckC